MNTQEALLVLNMIPGLGPVKIQRLTKTCGDAARVFSTSRTVLEKVEGISESIIADIQKAEKEKIVDEEIKRIREAGVLVLFINEPNYPELLKNIYDPPSVIYYKGEVAAFRKKSIAVVGTRFASIYGKKCTKMLCAQLVREGFAIVSGLARGIDGVAHQSALEAGGSTSAVLGCGLSYIYPPEHKNLANRMIEKGCLLSEFPMTAGPLPQNFPRRNRIISGLTIGTIVVEASSKSGALITANWALEQGREVFAVPGCIGVKNTEGTHQLIQNGAKLVNQVGDILDEFGISKQLKDGGDQVRILEPLVGDENKVLEVLQQYDPLHIDEICRQTGLLINQISGILMLLEIKGYIKQIGGKKFIRTQY